LVPKQFFIWGDGAAAKKIRLADIVSKNATGGLIHWAGAKRTPFVKQMTRGDILTFFQEEYYKDLFMGSVLIKVRPARHLLYTYILRLKNKLKSIFGPQTIIKSMFPVI